MNKFSKASLEKLETCHPSLQILFHNVIELIDCTVLCGHRTKEEQNRAYQEGRSRCMWPDSTHNELKSLAVDVAPYYIEEPHIRWDALSYHRWYFFGGIVIAEAARLKIPIRWGGDWESTTYLNPEGSFNDLPHFELRKLI